VRGSVGGHLTDVKIWLFARSEEAKNILKKRLYSKSSLTLNEFGTHS
jgi:hypothetical protein